MSQHQPWKDLERRFAKLMKGKRLWRPDFSESIPDGESDTHTWDVKCYARHAVVSMFVENERKYRGYTGSRRFVLGLFSRDRRGAGDFVVVRASHYAADQDTIAELTTAFARIQAAL